MYDVQLIGPATPTEVNDTGVAVGYRFDNGGNRVPLVSAPGAGWSLLPLPPAATGAWPTDINTGGTVVGVSLSAAGAAAVRWTPSASGYAVDVLPRLAGETTSFATGINDAGQIVGARAAGIVFSPTEGGWLIDTDSSIRSLDPAFGGPSIPLDISGNGLVVAGTRLLDLGSGSVTDLGSQGPGSYLPITLTRVNSVGVVAGTGTLNTVERSLRSAFRYLPGAGWSALAGPRVNVAATDLNGAGDVTVSDLSPLVHLAGHGTYLVADLIDPADAAAGWQVTGQSVVENATGMLIVQVSNTLTGATGAARLIPTGPFPTPGVPVGVSATSHPATSLQPYAAIVLTWTRPDTLVRSYEIERRPLGGATWTPVGGVVSASVQSYDDLTVAASTAYDYRIRAVGVAGPGPWSPVVTATAPSLMADPQAPLVAITSPADGAQVSGIVSVTMTASDNGVVESMRLSYWDQFAGREVDLGTSQGGGTLTGSWDTRALTPAAYELRAVAVDTFGNVGRASVLVSVAATPKTTMQVTSIAMSAQTKRGSTTVRGVVSVRTVAGTAVSGATVAAQWRRPDGGTIDVVGLTGSRGTVTFTTPGAPGTWVLAIDFVQKVGVLWDPAGSVLSQTLTL